jgi:F-type H+-transporting ATPase subunit delta
MLKGAIARRYAEAMFQIALKQNTVDRTLEDVKNITQVFTNRKLAYLLREPKVPTQRKEKALREAFTKRVLPTSLNLALLIVQRELVDTMPNIAKELETLVLDYRNEATAEVTTAAPLDQAQSDLVKQSLEHSTGKSIIMTTRVDPSILGGIIARVGDQLIDSSVRYRLQALERELLTGIATTSVDDSSYDDSSYESVPV